MVGLDYKGGDSTHCFFSVCFRWKGLRDDLLFLLEEELCGVNLCAQHCELRITEQFHLACLPMTLETSRIAMLFCLSMDQTV